MISRHKTCRYTGTMKLPLSEHLSKLFQIWVSKYRSALAVEVNAHHGHVFLHRFSSQPFTSKTFSNYFSRKSQELLGVKLNLQIIRRIFATGVQFISAFHAFSYSIRLLEQKPFSGELELAGHSNDDRNEFAEASLLP